jgi:peptidoglycan/LPS O-acetylase OafA/YrhL
MAPDATGGRAASRTALTSAVSVGTQLPASSSVAARAPRHYVPYLDSLRAFAILLVLAVHAGVPGSVGAWLGVDLFFPLSGFLITTLLLDEWQQTRNLALRRFWVRRFLRLMPAYYLYIGLVTLAIFFWPGSETARHYGWTPGSFVLSLWGYFVNFAPKGGIWNGQGITVHLWSLAVEEQYYALWPVCLYLLLRYAKRRALWSWLLCAAVLAYFVMFSSEHDRDTMLYGRGFSLFLASALAVTLHQSAARDRLPSLFRSGANAALTVALLLTVAALALLALQVVDQDRLRRFFLPELVLSYAVAIGALWYGSVGGIWGYVLSRPALVYLGRISYGLYLYHVAARVFVWWATTGWFGAVPRPLAYAIRLSLYVLLAIALAAASFHFYERPFLGLKRSFR